MSTTPGHVRKMYEVKARFSFVLPCARGVNIDRSRNRGGTHRHNIGRSDKLAAVGTAGHIEHVRGTLGEVRLVDRVAVRKESAESLYARGRVLVHVCTLNGYTHRSAH